MAVVFEVKKEIPADIAEGQNCLICSANSGGKCTVHSPGNGNLPGLSKGIYAGNWKCTGEAYLDLSFSSIRLARCTESPIGATS